MLLYAIWDYFHNLKKREKLPWRSVTFSKVAGLQPAFLLKVTLLHGFFSCFLNRANGTKARNASHIICTIVIVPVSYVKNTDSSYVDLCIREYSLLMQLNFICFSHVLILNDTLK